MAGRAFDEWAVGTSIVHELRRTVTETNSVLVTTLTDNPQPLHLDADYAAGTKFYRIVVNGLLTSGLMVGISVGDTTLGTRIANLGYDNVVMPKHVFVSDTPRAETEVIALRESKSRSDAGLVICSHYMLNQRDEEVCSCLRTALLEKSA